MKNTFLVCLSLATALMGAKLFWIILYQLGHYDWLGYSYRADELGDVHYYYTFGYVVVFAVACFFRWPVSPQRQAVATGVVLLGGVMPLLSVCFNYYLHSKWLIGDILHLERGALASLFVAHGLLLILVNGILYFTNTSRRKQSITVHSDAEPGRTTGTVYLGK